MMCDKCEAAGANYAGRGGIGSTQSRDADAPVAIQREVTGYEMAESERLARESAEDKLRWFFQCPTNDRYEVFRHAANQFQAAWMQGRKRVIDG